MFQSCGHAVLCMAHMACHCPQREDITYCCVQGKLPLSGCVFQQEVNTLIVSSSFCWVNCYSPVAIWAGHRPRYLISGRWWPNYLIFCHRRGPSINIIGSTQGRMALRQHKLEEKPLLVPSMRTYHTHTQHTADKHNNSKTQYNNNNLH